LKFASPTEPGLPRIDILINNLIHSVTPRVYTRIVLTHHDIQRRRPKKPNLNISEVSMAKPLAFYSVNSKVKKKARSLVNLKKVTNLIVTSESVSGLVLEDKSEFEVVLWPHEKAHCSCIDFNTKGGMCQHLWAISMSLKKNENKKLQDRMHRCFSTGTSER
jgi:hypothetical protein